MSSNKNYLSNIDRSCNYKTPPTKEEVAKLFFDDMVQTSLSMFEWKGLPEGVDSHEIESYKQLYGCCLFAKHNGKYYVFFGNPAPPLDAYYHSTKFIVANPWLNLSKTYDIGKDSVIIKNDYLMEGLYEWHKYYAYLLAEAYMSMRIGLINSRSEFIIATDTDNEANGAKSFLEKLEKGESIGYILNDNMVNKEGLRTLQYGTGAINSIRSGVETTQYLYSQWARGIGLNSSYNIKREYVSATESATSVDTALPKVDQMLACAKHASEQINQLFGLHTSVDFSSVWKRTQEEEQAELDNRKNEGAYDDNNNSNAQNDKEKQDDKA